MSASHRPKKVLAFDWDSQRVRVVNAVLTKRGPKVDRLLCVSIPEDVDPTHPEQMGRLLRQILDQESIGTTHAMVDVPRDQAILNTLNLPCRVPDELPAIVALQIAKQLPFAVGDAVVDYAVGPHAEDAVTGEVLVAAVRHDVLKFYEAVFAAAGLKLIRIGLRPYANKVAVCELLRHALPERVLFIDVGPTLTEINILRGGYLAFSRAASVAMDELRRDPADEEGKREGAALTLVPASAIGEIHVVDAGRRRADVVATLVQEVAVSVEAFRASDPGARIDHVVIGGDLGVEESLAEALQNRLQVTVDLYNPGSTFGWEPDEGVQAAACAATLGLVLGYSTEDALEFDFLHPKKVVSATQRQLRKAPLVAAVAVLFLAAGGVAVAKLTKDDRMRLAAIERKIVELRGKSSENQKFLSLVKEIHEFEGKQLVWVDVLFDITGNLPSQQEMVVNQMELNQKEEKVVLKTRAKRRETALEAVRQLMDYRREGREKPRFRAVLKQQSEKPTENYPFVQDIWVHVLDDEGKLKRTD